jgi:HEAT repeat protein
MTWKTLTLTIFFVCSFASVTKISLGSYSGKGIVQDTNKLRQQPLELILPLLDHNAEFREQAFKKLQALGIDAYVTLLIEALQDKDENVRVSAATALSQLGIKAKPASRALTKALWDGNWFVRRQASKALSVLGLDSVDIPLMVDPFNEIQETSNGGIISLVTAIDPSVLDHPESISRFFIKALQSQDPKIRKSAASALGQIRFTIFANFGNKESIDALILALKDQEDQVRVNAAVALGSFSQEKSGKNIDQIRSSLLAVINSDKNPRVRASAIEALGNTLPFEFPVSQLMVAKQITSASTKALKDKDDQVRKNAIELLDSLQRNIKNSDFSPAFKDKFYLLIYPPLVNALYDKDEGVRQEALKSLSDLSDNTNNLVVSEAMNEVMNIVKNKKIDKEIRRSIVAFYNPSSTVISKILETSRGKSIFLNLLKDKNEDFGIKLNAFIALKEANLLNSQRTNHLISDLSLGLQLDDPVIQLDAINGISRIIENAVLNDTKLDSKTASKIRSQLPSLNNCLQSPIKPIRYASALTINKIEPSQESPIPVLKKILSEETDSEFRENAAFLALSEIDSPKAALAMVESAKLDNQRLIYVRSCRDIPLPNKHKALLVKFLKDESVRQILAENLSYVPSDDSEKSEYRKTVDALISLLKKEDRNQDFQNQDIRRSAAYTLGEFLSSNKKHGFTEQKIIEALTVVVNDSNDNLDVRWMAATSLQEAEININNFFKDNNLINPKTVQCPFPQFGQGLSFDRYEQRCLYSTKQGCGDGPTQIFSTLRRLLASKNSRKDNNSNTTKK